MEEIKELVAQALEQKRVLARMKAELRAQVFLAIDEQEKGSGNEGLAEKTSNPQRDSLLRSADGMLLVALVREFLEWSGMEFTAKVFEPEMGPAADYKGRMDLSKQLGVAADVSSESPLLLTVLKRFQSGGSGAAAPTPAALSSPGAAARLSPLAPLGRVSPLAPIGDAKSPDSEGPGHGGSGRLPPPPPMPMPRLDAPSAAASSSEPPLAAPRVEQPARPVSALPPKPSTPAMPPPPPAAMAATTAKNGDDSYADDLEIEDDADLENAEIVDEDEDYSAVFGQGSSGGGAGAAAVVSTGSGAKRLSGSGEAEGSRSAGSSGGGTKPAAPGAVPDLSESNLSASSFTPGRIRPSKSRVSGGESGLVADDNNMGFSGGRRSNGGDDLTLSGDRSFGISHELAGLAPPQPTGRHSNSGLSLSGDLPPNLDESKTSPTGFGGLSASRSGDLSMSGGLKPAKLEPLAPLGGKPPLGKLAPLGKPGLPPAGGSGLAPLAAPASVSGRKDPGDIKEELRRAGLLTLAESRSVGSRSRSVSGSGAGSDAEASIHASEEDSGSMELELPDNTPSQDLAELAPPVKRRSSSGGGAGTGSRLGPSGSNGAGGSSAGGAVSAGGASARGGVVKPLKGGIYDAEFSVSQSFAEEVVAEVVEEDIRSSLESDVLGRSANFPSGGGAGMLAHMSKGLSLDMRDTGLSASDKSGELDMGDLAETAEWA